MIDNDDIINKSAFKWNFKEDDWFIDIIFNNPALRYKIFIIKDYSASTINSIVFETLNLIHNYRTELEKNSKEFIAKKNYLLKHNGNKNIQISLEEEYLLKDLIDKYKIYELIGWTHLGKNHKIFKQCVLEKQNILTQIYPIVDLSIRKVIGSKVFNVKERKNQDIFEDAVNNAWFVIINYLTKIDTSKVMFSILVGLAHRSAIYMRCEILKDAYNTTRISDLKFNNDDEEDVTEDLFINSVISNNENLGTSNYIEDNLIDSIDYNNLNNNYYDDIDGMDNEYDDIISVIDNPNRTNILQQNILAHSFNILSGKIKKICFDKIFAEFFFDLISNKITEKVINKHTPILLDIMNLAAINPEIVNAPDKNTEVFKLFRSWLKEKAKTKLIEYNINLKNKGMSEVKKQQLEELTKKEKLMLDYLKDHKKDTISKLIKFKNDCINFKN